LPPEAVRQGVLAHPSFFINETLSRPNPLYTDRRSYAGAFFDPSVLNTMIARLCEGNTDSTGINN
jgi:hypothetical protein